MLAAIAMQRYQAMRHSILIAFSVLLLGSVTACGSPPTKSVRTTTTTTTTDESGNASAQAHSELRTNVPVTSTRTDTMSRTMSAPVPYDTKQTVEESQSTDLNGTTTTKKRVTNY